MIFRTYGAGILIALCLANTASDAEAQGWNPEALKALRYAEGKVFECQAESRNSIVVGDVLHLTGRFQFFFTAEEKLAGQNAFAFELDGVTYRLQEKFSGHPYQGDSVGVIFDNFSVISADTLPGGKNWQTDEVVTLSLKDKGDGSYDLDGSNDSNETYHCHVIAS